MDYFTVILVVALIFGISTIITFSERFKAKEKNYQKQKNAELEKIMGSDYV